jgi:phosphoribosylformylglycinamidine synthase|tara:strand:- start:261 stop:512 length:252 start_codon:yes stop_codon:yes gene_type:complete
MFLAHIYVTLKPSVNDPQGKTILAGLKSLGFFDAKDVRIGKFLEITVDCPNVEEAQVSIDHMCTKLLSNPIIENYSFVIEQKD